MKLEPLAHPLRVRVTAEIRPSEDAARVERAVANLFPEIALTRGEDGRRVEGTSQDSKALAKLREQIQQRQTAGVAARLLRSRASRDHTSLYLHKQAAMVERAILCEDPRESPLGPIVLEMEYADLEGLIRWLAPF